ncbi:hypothetical protein [Myxococcus sp. AS-1-15]|uniref:hypothetical protein n=1 Tax=Myxococcus sp. AS-1-15 TaxID=2874600 RepID=UPI001CBB0251|nr:hypothetical protein [Myxococcus sp. AS-1-15]MBZ4394128.1 hypothetical protein [Myxococcus sp. AS-1-15]
MRVAVAPGWLVVLLVSACAHPASSERTGATGCSAPGTLCWDFEEGRLPEGWTPFRDEFSGQLLVDATRAHGGRYSLHASQLVGGREGEQGGPKKTVRFQLPKDFGPVLWGRVHVYVTPARPASHAGLFNARYPRPGSQDTAFEALDWYEVATYQEKYMAIWHPPEPPGFPEWVQVSDTPLVLDRWACVEWLFDGANGDAPQAAEPRVWLDGVELKWPRTFVFSDPPTEAPLIREKARDFTVLEAGVFLYQGLSTPTDWWLDDLAVGPRRVGCE